MRNFASQKLNEVPQALSASPEYMFGVKEYDLETDRFHYGLETVTLHEISRAVCLAPTSEGHGVRGFIATVVWPAGTTAGEIQIQGADLNEDSAYHALGTILFPGVQYSSPSGLVVNFMRTKVVALPAPHHQVSTRLMIR
jgi:hypothetical protein